jgi:hypothetical protein
MHRPDCHPGDHAGAAGFWQWHAQPRPGCKNEHAELVIFDKSSHVAFIEEREAYIRVAEGFLGRVEAGSRR